MRKLALLTLLVTVMAAAAGCDIIGYQSSPFAGDWQTIQDIDPNTGQTRAAIITTTRGNGIFALAMSLFRKPTLTVACIGRQGSQQRQIVINWLSAIGIPGQQRYVSMRLDNADAQREFWMIGQSGRSTILQGAKADSLFRAMANSQSVWAQVASPNKSHILIFNLNGIGLVQSAVDCS